MPSQCLDPDIKGAGERKGAFKLFKGIQRAGNILKPKPAIGLPVEGLLNMVAAWKSLDDFLKIPLCLVGIFPFQIDFSQKEHGVIRQAGCGVFFQKRVKFFKGFCQRILLKSGFPLFKEIKVPDGRPCFHAFVDRGIDTLIRRAGASGQDDNPKNKQKDLFHSCFLKGVLGRRLSLSIIFCAILPE